MLNFFMFFFILFSLILIFLMKFFYTKKSFRSEASAFECGIDCLSLPRIPFSVRFFYMLILFLMLDVELSIFLNLPILLLSSTMNKKWIIFISMKILLLSILEEYRQGLLKWFY